MRIPCLLLLLAACAGGGDSGADGPAGRSEALDVTADAVQEGGEVRLRLRVANPADTAVTLEYPSGQRYDFAVSRPDGTSLWSWSAARSFIAEYGTETLGAGDTLAYEERWDPAGVTGPVVVEARVTSRTLPAVRRVRLTVSP